MHQGITIRKAEISDAEAIMKVTRSAFSGYKIPVTPMALTESLEDIKNDISTKAVLVAEDKGAILGCVRLSDTKGGLYLSRFAVDSAKHRSGIGVALLKFSENFAKERSYKFIKLHTSLEIPSLVRFYKRSGFALSSFDTSRGYKRGEMVKNI